jgi:hypothetical protein
MATRFLVVDDRVLVFRQRLGEEISHRSLAADGSQSRHDPGADLGVVDQLDLARVQRLHPADQFRNLDLVDACVLAIFVEAIQQRTRCSGALVGWQSQQLCKVVLSPRHMVNLDAVLAHVYDRLTAGGTAAKTANDK